MGHNYLIIRRAPRTSPSQTYERRRDTLKSFCLQWLPEEGEQVEGSNLSRYGRESFFIGLFYLLHACHYYTPIILKPWKWLQQFLILFYSINKDVIRALTQFYWNKNIFDSTLWPSKCLTVQDKTTSLPSGTVTFRKDWPTNPGSVRVTGAIWCIEEPSKINHWS